MYFSLNEERVVLNFNPSPYVKITGPDKLYYVEMREYVDNDDKSLSIDSYKVSSTDTGWRTWFNVPIEFYGEFEISISKYVPNYGIKKIYTHRYNDYGKFVMFNLSVFLFVSMEALFKLFHFIYFTFSRNKIPQYSLFPFNFQEKILLCNQQKKRRKKEEKKFSS